MFLLPTPFLTFILLTSLITASIVISRNDPSLPRLLILPTANDTTLPPPNPDSADPTWYPYAASPFPINPIPSPLSNSDTISSFNTTTTNNSSLPTSPNIVCNGSRYGRNLRVASCLSAVGRMDSTTIPKTYGQRDSDHPSSTTWDANLPLRILSSDARCALDVTHSPRSPSDTIAPSELKEHALILLTICVQGSPSIGGVATNIGQNGDLALRITPYRPNVHCFGQGTGPPWETCRDIVDGMPVGGEQVRFGPQGDPGTKIVVPWRRTTVFRRCEITIDTVSEPDVSDFYKLWAAANAVDTLCTIKGKAGMAVGNGVHGNLVVGLKDLQSGSSEEGTGNVSVETEGGGDAVA